MSAVIINMPPRKRPAVTSETTLKELSETTTSLGIDLGVIGDQSAKDQPAQNTQQSQQPQDTQQSQQPQDTQQSQIPQAAEKLKEEIDLIKDFPILPAKRRVVMVSDSEEEDASKPIKKPKVTSKLSKVTPSLEKIGREWKFAQEKRNYFDFVNRQDGKLLYKLEPYIGSLLATPTQVYSIATKTKSAAQFTEFTLSEWHFSFFFEIARTMTDSVTVFEDYKQYPLFMVSRSNPRKVYATKGDFYCDASGYYTGDDFSETVDDYKGYVDDFFQLIEACKHLKTSGPVDVMYKGISLGVTNVLEFKDDQKIPESLQKTLLLGGIGTQTKTWKFQKPYRTIMITSLPEYPSVPIAVRINNQRNKALIVTRNTLTSYDDLSVARVHLQESNSPLLQFFESSIANKRSSESNTRTAVEASSNDFPGMPIEEQIKLGLEGRLMQGPEDDCIEVALTHAICLENIPSERIVVKGNSIIKTLVGYGLKCRSFEIRNLKGKPHEELVTRVIKTAKNAKIGYERLIITSRCVTTEGRSRHSNFAEVLGDSTIRIWNTWNSSFSRPMGAPDYKFQLYEAIEPDLWAPINIYFIWE